MAHQTVEVRTDALQYRRAALSTTRKITAALFGSYAHRDFTINYWDAVCEQPEKQSRFTLHLKHPGAMRRMLLPPTELTLGTAFIQDDFDIEGSLEVCLDSMHVLIDKLRNPAIIAQLMKWLVSLPHDSGSTPVDLGRHMQGRLHSRERDAAAVRAHYDIGNDFYRLWLDQRMIYTCGYFATGTEDLDTAQTAKLDLICRKLRLQPGERLLDIGCGWGGLIMYAAQHYGVHAVGVTLSTAQAELARKRIAEAGLNDRCRIENCDYRDYHPTEPFDKVVSVEMFEQVGRSELPTFYRTMFRLTKPGGLFLNQGIMRMRYPRRMGLHERLIERFWFNDAIASRYVFPDGELENLGTNTAHAESAGFETRDIESIREHYVLTLRHWVRRLETCYNEVVRLVGEQNYRIWRLYMSAAAHSFAHGLNTVNQAQYGRRAANDSCGLPLARADIYTKKGM